MTTDISCDVITHRLKIKWMDVKYITYKTAQNIFDQIVNPDQSSVTILNPENLTFISKYKSDIELIPIEWMEKTAEDLIYSKWLSKSEKETLRIILEARKKDNQPITEWIIINIIEAKFKK